MKKVVYGILVIALVGIGGYYLANNKSSSSQTYKTPQEADAYVRFGMEAFDDIQANYWDTPADYNLPKIFQLSIQKVSGQDVALATTTRDAVAEMLSNALKTATTTDAKKNMILNTLIVVTFNLQPAGRDQVLSTAQETQLRNTVSNINPAKDLYQDLGLTKGASVDQVQAAYKQKSAELAASTSPQAKTELDQVAYAKKVLTNTNNKSLYDQNQIEPTVWPHVMGKTLYIYISQMAPTTFMEFAKAVDNASTTPGLDSMILDLRGNIGGSLDFVQNFMGLFLGANQYAFDLFHQGNYNAQRTVQPKFDELGRFQDIALLTDSMTQSTAEVISATFKRLHLGHTVGAKTRGWGTVENTYPINTQIDPSTKYSLLLVNSITLRDDNQPIESRGVDPDVSISDSNWKSELSKFFHSTSLINALGSEANKAPIE